jgi:hypothetical protein
MLVTKKEKLKYSLSLNFMNNKKTLYFIKSHSKFASYFPLGHMEEISNKINLNVK